MDPSIVSAIAAGVSALTSMVIVFVYRGQWKTMEAQARYMRAGLDETRNAADATRISAEAAKENAESAAAMLATNRAVERAYVDISHSPDGARINRPDASAPDLLVRFEIKNHGRTPATVWRVVVHPLLATDLPTEPPYERSARSTMSFFLMPGESAKTDRVFPVASWELQQVRARTLKLWVIGFVDYEDTFGDRHRSGYARWYDPTLTGNNLSFETMPGYNYDIDIDEQGRPKETTECHPVGANQP